MLTNLYIKNYALIDEINIDFDSGLTTITGETGAGKSILLGGLSLVLGKRADLSILKDKSKKCIIEAKFSIKDYGLKSFFSRANLDYDSDTLIRREILPEGIKSRAFINDTPVTLDTLSALSKRLIDVHSQYDTSQVGDGLYHLHILDLMAENASILEEYKNLYVTFKKVSHHLTEMISQQQSLRESYDYDLFSLKELQDLNLSKGLQSSLEKELDILSNIDQVYERLTHIIQNLSGEQTGILSLIREIRVSSLKLSPFGEAYEEIHQRIQSASIELDDILSEVKSQEEGIEMNPKRLEEVTKSLDRIYDLQRKHSVNDENGLIDIEKKLEEKIHLVEFSDEDIKKQKQLLLGIENKLDNLAEELHKRRNAVIEPLVERLEKVLLDLGMPHSKFKVGLEVGSTLFENGKDDISFLFSANKNTPFGEIDKVASGGERSRIILAIKSILSAYMKLPAIIFDEIDTGVSGQVALKTVEVMSKMSETMQVIAITHLPQIAAKGDSHLKVFKMDQENTTQINIKPLNDEERILEIAEMLSGKSLPASAIKHASELLKK